MRICSQRPKLTVNEICTNCLVISPLLFFLFAKSILWKYVEYVCICYWFGFKHERYRWNIAMEYSSKSVYKSVDSGVCSSVRPVPTYSKDHTTTQSKVLQFLILCQFMHTDLSFLSKRNSHSGTV